MVLPQVYQLAFVCCSIASVALLVWDHVLTFGDEVSKIWSRKFSGATVLYCLLRYGTLVEKMSVMFLASWNMSPHGCNFTVRFQIFPMALRTIGFGLFSSLRVYALRGKDWRLASFIFLLCLPSLLIPSYTYAHQWASGVDRYGCELAYLASPVVHDRSECYFFYGEVATNAVVVRIAGIIGDILSETIVIIVTFMKTYRLRKDLEPAAVKMGLAQLLFRDGTIYFVALLILSLADMLVLIFDHVPQPVVGYDYWVVPYYTPVFRTIIICRFLLMLRAIYYNDDDNDTGTQVLSMRFASGVVGPLGTTVDPDSDDDYNGNGDDEDDDDDDESIPRGNIEGVVFSKDPFAAGMGLTKTRGKEKEAPVEVSV